MSSFKEYLQEHLKNSALPAPVKNFFLSPRPAIIYGAGSQSRLAMDFCHFYQKPVECLLVSPGGQRGMPYWQDMPLYQADSNLPPSISRQADVILALHEKHYPEIIARLKALGFSSIYPVANWNDVNEELRDIWYDAYFSYHKIASHLDSDGESYIAIPVNLAGRKGRTEYKCYYPQKDKIMRSNIIGELNDIVLPSILDDSGYFCEGPYEYGEVRLNPEDVVLDLGANMGLFSGVAAAKAARVYAFEPTPMTIDYLEKNTSFYDNVTICPYAVSDSSGKATFHINADLDADKSLGSNSMFRPEGNAHWQAVEVECVAIDDFVERKGLERVDFIKADIEGAERRMLRGARKTLARFSPRLALCEYHMRDDPQVLEELILQANPGYRIIHKWSKLYAWCPDEHNH